MLRVPDERAHIAMKKLISGIDGEYNRPVYDHLRHNLNLYRTPKQFYVPYEDRWVEPLGPRWGFNESSARHSVRLRTNILIRGESLMLKNTKLLFSTEA